MPTRAEVTAYSRAQNTLVTAAKWRLDAMMAALGDSVWDADVLRSALDDVFPALVADFGDAAATLAAEWFEQQIGAQAVLAETIGADVAIPAARSAMDPLFAGDVTQVFANLGGILDRLIKQAGRDTIRESARRAGVRWARVPSGAKTCAFCLMLASRGAVYASEDTADGGRYHNDCDCVATPFKDGDDLPRGYDPEALTQAYVDARKVAGGNTKAILSVMREQQGIS